MLLFIGAAEQEALSKRNSKPFGRMFKIFNYLAQSAFPHLPSSSLLLISLIGPHPSPGPGMFRPQSSVPLLSLQADCFAPHSIHSCHPCSRWSTADIRRLLHMLNSGTQSFRHGIIHRIMEFHQCRGMETVSSLQLRGWHTPAF